MWQRKPTGGRALKGVTTAVSPSVLALRSEQGKDIFPRVATQPEKDAPRRQALGPSRDKGASKGPYTPPPNTGQHRQPNNNSLLC